MGDLRSALVGSAGTARALIQLRLVLLDLGALVVVDTGLRGSAVSLLVGENVVVAADLAGPDMLVHTAVEVLADTDIDHLAGVGIDNAVFALGGGHLAAVGGIEGLDLGRSAGLVK